MVERARLAAVGARMNPIRLPCSPILILVGAVEDDDARRSSEIARQGNLTSEFVLLRVEGMVVRHREARTALDRTRSA